MTYASWGGILLVIALSYLVLCFTIRKPVHIFGKEFVFPIPASPWPRWSWPGVDLIAAAACMYVLLPDDLGIGFIDFLPSYLMAQVAVVLTHVPGGVGVFELVILHLTHTPREQAVFAAVLLFRLIYFILPLLAAAPCWPCTKPGKAAIPCGKRGAGFRYFPIPSRPTPPSWAAASCWSPPCCRRCPPWWRSLTTSFPVPCSWADIWSVRFPGPCCSSWPMGWSGARTVPSGWR